MEKKNWNYTKRFFISAFCYDRFTLLQLKFHCKYNSRGAVLSYCKLLLHYKVKNVSLKCLYIFVIIISGSKLKVGMKTWLKTLCGELVEVSRDFF